MAKNQFNRLILLLLLAVGGTQGLVTYTLYRNTEEALLNVRLVSAANAVLRDLDRLHLRVAVAESARRGYLLTQDRSYLVLFFDSAAAVTDDLERLNRQVRDPGQRKGLKWLESALQNKMDHMKRLDVASSRRRETVESGKAKMDALRIVIASMETAEERLLQERQVLAEKSRRKAELTLILGSVIGFCLLSLTLFLLHREGRRRQRAEDALRRSEEQYRTLARNIPDVPWKTDAEGAPTYIGEGIQGITGYTPEELIAGRGAFWRSRVHQADLEVVNRGFSGLFEQGLPLDAQYRFQTKAGLWAWMYARASVVSVEDGMQYTQGLLSDISPRKEAEENNARLAQALVDSNRELEARNQEVERATQLKSRFLANMSHELRTPLNAIMGFSELLGDPATGETTERQRRWLGHIRNGSTHLLQLINDILDLSKIEADQMEFCPEAVRLSEVIPEVMAIVRPLAQSRRVNLAEDVPEDLVAEVDRTRLKQIIYNLMSNAVKFTPAHGLVRIEAVAFAEFICISVRDTGVGIRPEDQEIIFEEFRQASETNKGVLEGTGLGLAITKRLVERQGGRIWLESETGKGSRFSFTLRKGKAPPVVPVTDPDAQLRNKERSILIVDDEEVTRDLLLSHLHAAGFQTLTARTASQGLQVARAQLPDAIILEVLLPDGDGWDLLQQLKQDPVTVGIPVIVVSIVDRKEKGFTLGAADYLMKPVSGDALMRTLQQHLSAEPDARVLIVEDEAADREVLSDILAAGGFRCHAVSNGKEGLEALLQGDRRFHLVILDLMLPEMDGFEFLHRVKENKRLREIPVVVLTGKDLTSAESDFLRAESHGLFVKGEEWRNDFIQEVEKVLYRRALPVAGASS